MSARGRWFITPHAVRRYRERCRPGLSYERALGELIRLSEAATFKRWVEPTVAEYVGPKPNRWRFRVSTVGKALPQLLTVLGHAQSEKPC